MERFSRSELLLGEAAMQKLKNARVAVFGVGGVGGYAVEALARTGIGALDLIDADTVSLSNINRQLLALDCTVGRLKVEVAAERIGQINPACRVKTYPLFYGPLDSEIDFSVYDYVVDAVDTVSAKLTIIERAKRAGVPVISAMGAGNKLDAAAFEVADIAETSICPLARVMRKELKKRGIEGVKVVYSKEEPLESVLFNEESGKPIPASVAFVPSVVGMIVAGEVIKDLIK
ncbi:MAG: tRNA threonylcarbamoyladenosine dehydratase [Clostridia bacterium]|nr:tRNA threonylcarbamoyladenosine dehydratase [Clostridia bacterium]